MRPNPTFLKKGWDPHPTDARFSAKARGPPFTTKTRDPRQHVVVPNREHETRVQLRLVPACEVSVQPLKAKKNAELESPHSHGFEAGSSDTPTMI